MGRADVGRTEQIPFRIEPEVGQGPKNKGQSASGNKGRHIFQEDEIGSHVANDADDIVPEPALVGDAEALSGTAPGLTGKSGKDATYASTPACASEGGQIRPDRRWSHDAFFHARDHDFAGIRFDLNVADDASSGQRQSQSEIEAPDAGAEREPRFGT